MKKLKQIMLVSSNFETFGKRLWRMVEVNAEEPVKIDRKKSKFKHFDTLEDIIEYYELKNVKVLNKSNDVNNVLWFFDGKDIDSEFWLADIEGEDYKKNDVDDLEGFVDYLETFLKGDGWKDGYGNHFDGNGNFEYRIDDVTGNKSCIKLTPENTIYDPILRRSILKSEQSNKV